MSDAETVTVFDNMRCAHCGAHAACISRYEDDEQPWAFACDERCGHGNEDGRCFALADAPSAQYLAMTGQHRGTHAFLACLLASACGAVPPFAADAALPDMAAAIQTAPDLSAPLDLAQLELAPVDLEVDAAHAPLRIIPLGDSITRGTPYPPGGGYRTHLWGLAATAGVPINFEGALSAGPSTLPDQDHSGYAGYTIEMIESVLPTALVDANPDVILLLAGANNVTAGDTPSIMLAKMTSLLDKVLAATATTHVLLGTMCPRGDPTDTNQVAPFNAGLYSLAATRPRVTVVDIFGAMSYSTDIADGVHPNDGGYTKIAAMWWPAILAATP